MSYRNVLLGFHLKQEVINTWRSIVRYSLINKAMDLITLVDKRSTS